VIDRAVRVEGLAQLRTAFRVAGSAMSKDLDAALRSAGEPVRQSAQSNATAGIRRIGVPWSRMRVGITRHTVYVAPVERGVKTRGGDRRRRPNLARLIQDRSLDPALEQNRAKVVQEVKDAVRDMGRAWGRV